MRDENIKVTIFKGIVTGAFMITCDDIVFNIVRPGMLKPVDGDFGIYRRKGNKLSNTCNHIAGLATGYVLGKRVANELVDGYEAAVKAYNGEDTNG